MAIKVTHSNSPLEDEQRQIIDLQERRIAQLEGQLDEAQGFIADQKRLIARLEELTEKQGQLLAQRQAEIQRLAAELMTVNATRQASHSLN